MHFSSLVFCFFFPFIPCLCISWIILEVCLVFSIELFPIPPHSTYTPGPKQSLVYFLSLWSALSTFHINEITHFFFCVWLLSENTLLFEICLFFFLIPFFFYLYFSFDSLLIQVHLFLFFAVSSILSPVNLFQIF